MSKITLSIKKKETRRNKINPNEPRKQLTEKERKIIERASIVFSVCKLKSTGQLVFKLRDKMHDGFYCNCVIPYTPTQLMNAKGGKKAHIQLVSKSSIQALNPSEYSHAFSVSDVEVLKRLASA